MTKHKVTKSEVKFMQTIFEKMPEFFFNISSEDLERATEIKLRLQRYGIVASKKTGGSHSGDSDLYQVSPAIPSKGSP